MVRKIVIILTTLLSAALSTAATPDKRIVGGEAVKHGEFPFLVTISDVDDRMCGGTLLDSTTVLTAAHCAFWSEDWLVRAGTLVSCSYTPFIYQVTPLATRPSRTLRGRENSNNHKKLTII
jgi:secreted trypsin-like serine protease